MAKRGTRKYLTGAEVQRLLEAATRGRYPLRDRLMIQFAYRHGLRVSELVDLRWSDVDFERGRVLIRRLKNGRTGTHPLNDQEKRDLKALRSSYEGSEHIFPSERGGRMHRQNVNRILGETAKQAEIPLRVTPHSLRHACGFELADRGVDTRRLQQYLGHRSILSTVVYTDLAGRALDGIWS